MVVFIREKNWKQHKFQWEGAGLISDGISLLWNIVQSLKIRIFIKKMFMIEN